MTRTTTEVIQDHLKRRLDGDIEGDIKNNFDKEVIVISSFGTYLGHDGVRESAEKLQKMVGEAAFVYNQTRIEKNYALLEWSAESENRRVCDGADSFVVTDGRIVMQSIHYTPEKTA